MLMIQSKFNFRNISNMFWLNNSLFLFNFVFIILFCTIAMDSMNRRRRNMTTFLDKETIKKLEIIEFLVENNGIALDSTISTALAMDKRTLLKLIKLIQNDLLFFNVENKVTLEINHSNKDINITFKSNFTLSELNLQYHKKSLNYIITKDIFFQNFPNPHHWANENYLSTSTLVRRLKEYTEFLTQYELVYDRAQPDTISGSEHQIRYFYFIFFWETHTTLEWPFPSIEKNKLIHFFSENQEIFSYLSVIDLERFMYLISISIHRIQSNNMIDYKYIYEEIENYSVSYYEFEKIIRELLESFLGDFRNIDNELIFLYFISNIIGTFSMDSFKTIDVSFLTSSHSSLSVPAQSSLLWIDSFTKYFAVNLTPKQMLFLTTNLVSLHTQVLYFTGSINIYGSNNSNNYVQEKYLLASTTIKKFTEHLNKTTDFPFNIAEFTYLNTQYTLLTLDILKKKITPLNVCLFSSINNEFPEILKKELSYHIFFPLIITNEVLPETDLIIADFFIDKALAEGKKSFQWNNFPTKQDWGKLIHIIDLFYMHQLDLELNVLS